MFGDERQGADDLEPARGEGTYPGIFAVKQADAVGDTPADILCARAGKTTAVAVASGWHAAPTLAKYKPDHLLEDLKDTKVVEQLLLE